MTKPDEATNAAGGERCSAARYRIGLAGKSGRTIDAYCIDARDDVSRCGPDAALFKPKRKGS
jgi:hypothetical protein